MAGANRGWYGWGHDDSADNSHEIKKLIDSRKPKNVILLIGDGMGDSEITLARYSTTPGAGEVRCNEANRPANEPSLAAMTDKAIDLLESRKGFFLQVEGASIDKRDHASDVCGQIGENLAFDQAVGVALGYQEDHEDTLVVITADHSHTSQIVPAGQDTPGFYATLKTADGFPIRVSYATARPRAASLRPAPAFPSPQSARRPRT